MKKNINTYIEHKHNNIAAGIFTHSQGVENTTIKTFF